MFEAKLENSFLFRKVVDGFKPLVEEITFMCDPRGIRSNSVDSCQVAFVQLFFPASDFVDYRCDESHSFKVYANLLLDSLKASDSDEEFTISMKSPVSDRIMMEFKNKKSGKTRKIALKVLDFADEQFIPASIDYSSICRMESIEFQKEMSHFHSCEVVKIKTGMSGIVFFAKNDNQTFETLFPPSDAAINSSVSIEQRSEVNSTFSVKYLTLFSKCAALSPMVELRFSNEAVCFKYAIGEDDGFMKFSISPRIDEEDME